MENKLSLRDYMRMSMKERLEYINTLENLLEEDERLLRAIPEYSIHGRCVPHAIEWVEKMKKLEEEQC